MTVFVTGATGYIGHAVARAFRAAGHRVLGLTRNPARRSALAGEEIEAVVGDLAAPSSYRDAAARAEILVHCAVESSREMVARDAAAIDALLAVARDAGTPRTLIYTSGVWVCGDTGGQIADEATPLAPFPFVAWRAGHEERVLAGGSAGLRSIVLRPGCVFGRSGGLTGSWFASAVAGEVEIVGDGANRWSMIHVDDLATAYVLAAERTTAGSVFNLNDGSQATVGEMARAVADAAGIPGRVRSLSDETARQRFGRIVPGLLADQRISAARARRELGWAPRGRPFADEAALHFAAYRAAAAFVAADANTDAEAEAAP